MNAKPKRNEPPYVGWRGELIARLVLTRAGLVVQDAQAPQPFDLLASTPDGFYLLVKVKAYSSMHSGRRPQFDGSHNEVRWPVEASVLRAAGEENVPAVLFVIDADREVGHYARLDAVSRSAGDRRAPSVPLTADHDLTTEALAALIAELRQDWALSRQPA
jgi:hypothetical protein